MSNWKIITGKTHLCADLEAAITYYKLRKHTAHGTIIIHRVDVESLNIPLLDEDEFDILTARVKIRRKRGTGWKGAKQ